MGQAKAAEPLRRDDLPFEIVADHPRLARADPEHFHCMTVSSLLGLAEPVLALNLDVVETVFEGETYNLGAFAARPHRW